MTSSAKRTLLWLVGAALLLIAAAVVLALRGRSAAPVAPMEDKEYLSQLDDLREAERQAAVKMSEAKAERDAAKAKGADSPELKAAEAKLAAAKDDFLKIRAKAERTVSDRMKREGEGKKAEKTVSNQKGE